MVDFSERRKYKRFYFKEETAAPVEICFPPPFYQEPIEGKILDVSAGGLGLALSEPLPKFFILSLTIRLSGIKPFDVKGKVVRIEKKEDYYKAGILFIEINSEAVETLNLIAEDYDKCCKKRQGEEKKYCFDECKFSNLCDQKKKDAHLESKNQDVSMISIKDLKYDANEENKKDADSEKTVILQPVQKTDEPVKKDIEQEKTLILDASKKEQLEEKTVILEPALSSDGIIKQEDKLKELLESIEKTVVSEPEKIQTEPEAIKTESLEPVIRDEKTLDAETISKIEPINKEEPKKETEFEKTFVLEPVKKIIEIEKTVELISEKEKEKTIELKKEIPVVTSEIDKKYSEYKDGKDKKADKTKIIAPKTKKQGIKRIYVVYYIFLFFIFVIISLFFSKDKITRIIFANAEKKLLIPKYESAIKDYKIVLKYDPKNLDAHLKLAEIYARMKMYINAAEEYSEVIKIKPDMLVALLEASKLNIKLNKHKVAYNYLKKARDISPDNLDVKIYTGIYYEKNKEYDKAMREFVSISSDSQLPEDVYFSIGKVLSIKGFFKKGMMFLANANLPKTASEYFNMGVIANENNTDEAIYGFVKAAVKKSDYTEVYEWLGHLYRRKGLYIASIDAYLAALNIKPESAITFLNLAKLYALKDDVENALTSLEKAISLDASLISSVKDSFEFNEMKNNLRFKKLMKKKGKK